MKMIRTMILATLVGPLFVGSVVTVIGAMEIWPTRIIPDNEEYIPVPDSVLSLALALPVVSLCAFSRPRRSEWAFNWLFVFGLSCLGLALFELHHEWERLRLFGVHPYWSTRPDLGLQRLLLIYSTLLLGIAQIVAAVWRIEFASLTARYEPTKSGGLKTAATSISEARKP